jgi:hypothetical protein
VNTVFTEFALAWGLYLCSNISAIFFTRDYPTGKVYLGLGGEEAVCVVLHLCS